jgi:hypothetical protein
MVETGQFASLEEDGRGSASAKFITTDWRTGADRR